MYQIISPPELVGKVYKARPQFTPTLIKIIDKYETSRSNSGFIPVLMWMQDKEPHFGLYTFSHIQQLFIEVDESEWLIAVIEGTYEPA